MWRKWDMKSERGTVGIQKESERGKDRGMEKVRHGERERGMERAKEKEGYRLSETDV